MSPTEASGAAATAAPATDPEAERYRSVAHRLHEIAKPIRVLSALRWPAAVRSRSADEAVKLGRV